MLTYPTINPVALAIGPINVHWYGIMYLIAFAMAFGVAFLRVRIYKLNWTKDDISDLIFYSAIGVILGGRLGYVFFYDFLHVLHDPLEIFKIWNGGMSFHGGLLGVICAIYFFARKTKRNFLNVTDFVVPLVPLGLAAGRIGNFINGELWGRVTDVSWGMIFPAAGSEIRHPSQLYEFALEGIILFILIWWYARKPRIDGSVSAMFLMWYAFCRCLIEFFREPDRNIGFVAFNWLTMGQLLSIVMFMVGFILLLYTRTWKNNENIS